MGCNLQLIIKLPWIDCACSPNARSHWTKLHAARARRKRDAFMLASSLPRCNALRAAVSIVFHPPDRRRYDLDNCLSALKGDLDGIAQRIGIDDHNFSSITIQFGEVVKNGSVIVEITPL